ncbi:MAG TPA: hypothetical protein VLX92_23925, partial [Kofleriaceae bacterium]|nr:hypothetical protein [Kofleriaceae bacterium]
ARFAGARPASLDAFQLAAASPETRLALLAANAPGSVFVAPVFDAGPQAAPVLAGALEPGETAAAAAAGAPVLRIDDDAETPDDLLAEISAAATRQHQVERAERAARKQARAAARAAAAAAQAAKAFAVVPGIERTTYADLVAQAAPSAPNAGLSAQLASSPFAPALRHVLPLAAAPSFDVRALFGDGLAQSYLAGLLASASESVTIDAAGTLRGAGAAQPRHGAIGAAWAGELPMIGAAAGMPVLPAGMPELAAAGVPELTAREVAAWLPTYVAPELAQGALAEPVAEAERVAAERAAIESTAAEAQRGAIAERAAVAGAVPEALRGAIAARTDGPGTSAVAETAPGEAAALQATLTTLRSALLAWEVEAVPAASPGAPAELRFAPPALVASHAVGHATTTSGATLASSMIDAMALPLLADASLGDLPGMVEVGGMPHAPAFAAPGMVADRAQAWSVAQERSSADLSFDFVAPELVLAARVYGLGPAEAAQAARLAIGGPGLLAAMAGTVDRTFVQALAIEAERRGIGLGLGAPGERGAVPGIPGIGPLAIATAYPTAGSPASARPGEQPGAAMLPAGEVSAAAEAELAAAPGRSTPSGSVFGVERRAPRGAFLWPSATVGALGLTAAPPDGEQSMSVAALELLAAQAVAELGTYAALVGLPVAGGAVAGEGAIGIDAGSELARPGEAGRIETAAAARAGAAAPGVAPEAELLRSAAAMVPAARRAKFDALYLALGQTAASRGWSPAARAARALALAGRGDEAITARERATIAWDVLPMVYAPERAGEDEPLSTGAAAQRAAERASRAAADPSYAFVESRPGLGALSARAGEALGSYVAPSAPSESSSTSSSSRDSGAVLRAPTAAQELVRTGRPAGRHGGGEVEIPPWFEAAARKMFEERSGLSDGISLAELTLVAAAPPAQVAASSRSAPSSVPPSAAPNSAASTRDAPQIDIEKTANEVYRQILTLMDAARARNGEPFL